MTRTQLIIAAAAAALLSGSIAHAAPDSELIQVKVSYSDLDLSTAQGVQILYTRIQSASANACDYLSGDASLSSRAQYKDCRRDFVSKMVRQINIPTLAQVASVSTDGPTSH